MRLFVAVVASAGLLSCGTDRMTTVQPETTSFAASDTRPAPAPQPVVVRSAIVPDDPEPLAEPVTAPMPARKRVHATMEPIEDDEPASTPAVTSTSSTPTPTPTPATPLAATTAAAAPAIGAPATSAVAEEPAAAAPSSITPPPAVAADAAGPADDGAAKAPPPSSVFNDPSSWLKDPKAFLQASIGGIPLWIVVLLGLLALISLVLAFRGKKKPEPKEEPVAG